MVPLVLALACGTGAPSDETLGRQDHIPTPDRSQIQVIDRELPAGLTDPAASAAYDQGYSHMRETSWFAAIAAYDEAIRLQPEVTRLYEAKGTAYMYAGQHHGALADYSHAIELEPTDAGLWRRHSHACTAADHRDTRSRELGTKKGRCDQPPNHAPEVTRRLNETRRCRATESSQNRWTPELSFRRFSYQNPAGQQPCAAAPEPL